MSDQPLGSARNARAGHATRTQRSRGVFTACSTRLQHGRVFLEASSSPQRGSGRHQLPESSTVMAMTTRSACAALLLFGLPALGATPARASFFSLAVSGTISENSSGDSTIPIGTPWTFELTYDTAAPD